MQTFTDRPRVVTAGVAGFRLVRALEAIRPGFGPAQLTAAAALVTGPVSAQVGVKSPWAAPANLAQVVWSDIFGAVPRPLTRAEAMRVPAVRRARGIICNTIARIELGDYAGTERLPAEKSAAWLERTDAALHPFHRMLWTVDDIYFHGFSLWRRTLNAAPTDGGFPLKMDRVPMGDWTLEPDTGRVLIWKPDPRGSSYGVTMQPATLGEVVLIAGPTEGVLVDGADSIRHAADLHRAANRAAKHPSAYLALQQEMGSPPLKRRSDDADEVTVESVVNGWVAAREGENGGVAYLSPGLKAVELGTFDKHLVVEGRNAAAVDIARHSDLPADLIDATLSQSSLNYTTSRDNDRRAIDYGLGGYMSAISACLSMDGVHPRGRRVAFDLEKWLQGAGSVPGQPAATPAPGMSPTAVDTAGETPQ